ncbi:MAG: Transcription termination protein NusA [uncultured Thermoleophilia bacterium]|uniref:Transcription termination/antitermination protein NusA n=1 Tax=uncultured Thermoleophilia bacterium TaxID=1497501 RepID=A0A6J4TUU3_9ACTN|nr:MAG: Transcription termination protein NusA [uncultured Thermoleophilia bacterium]
MSKEILEAVYELERQKSIDSEVLLTALEEALRAAYKKTPGSGRHVKVELDRESGDIRVFQVNMPDEELLELGVLTLPPEPDPDAEPEPEPEETAQEKRERERARYDFRRNAPEEPVIEEPEPLLDWDRVPQEAIEVIDVSRDNFGRIAAQTAKQVILQRIREAEREMMFEEYQDRVGDVVTGIVQQSDSRYCLVDLGKVEALLPGSEQVPGERYEHGARIKAVIIDVRSGTKGPQIVLSRRSEELIRELFELEVPEIADGLVVIRAVAREAGYRAKIAVESRAQGVDPVGACVGPRGSRVRMVVSELRGEKIDIIPWNDEPARFVAKALAPARVREVVVDDDDQQATVIVPDDQLSLAIGREGQNARLAARLTGWRIDIRSETEYAHEDSDEPGAAETVGRYLDTRGIDERRLRALLKEGKVSINGIVVRRPERLVGSDDVVVVDGATI